MSEDVDPEIGARVQGDMFLFSDDAVEHLGDEMLERISKAAFEYLSFFIPDTEGKISAEKAGIAAPAWLTKLVCSFREPPLPEKANDSGFFYADFMSRLFLDFMHGHQSQRVLAIKAIMKALDDPLKERSLVDARRKARSRYPEYREEKAHILTPFTLIYVMKNPAKIAAILDALNAAGKATIPVGEYGVFQVVKSDEKDATRSYNVCAFPHGGVVGLKIATMHVKGGYLMAHCNTSFRKEALAQFLELPEFGGQLVLLREVTGSKSLFPDDEETEQPMKLALYNAQQCREEDWAGKHYFALQKKAGMPYIAVRDRKVVATANTIYELLEKVKTMYGEPEVAKHCPFVTEQVGVLNLVYDGFTVLVPNAPRSQQDGRRMLDAEWDVLGKEVGRELAVFQGEVLRLFGMHQLTAQDIIRALRARFNVQLTEEELYEVAKYLFKMGGDMYRLMMRKSKLKLSDTWLLLAEKEFCLVVDSSSELILAARRGTDKVKLLKEAIKVGKRVPKTLITKGVKDTHPLAKVCPATFIQQLESAKMPHHASTAQHVIHNIQYLINLRARSKQDVSWLLNFAVTNHNLAPTDERIDNEPLSMADFKESDELLIPPELKRIMKEQCFTTLDEFNAWAENRPKPWLSGIWQAALWPASSVNLHIQEWSEEEGYVSLVTDVPNKEAEAEPYILAAKIARTKEEAMEDALKAAFAFANHKPPKVIQTIHPEDYEDPAKRLFGPSVKVEYLPP